MAESKLPVILFHYTYSPFARRIVWYLALRGIPYKQCLQPPMLPRPDLARLGINYRRIPVLAIGRDVYLDTRLILQKLEGLYPSLPRLGAQGNEEKALERLFELFMIDGGIFARGGQLLPPDLPLMKDRQFQKDRADFYGGPRMGREEAARLRPEALNEIKMAMRLLETTLLADGRDWILKTKEPSLADIEAVWIFHWLTGMPGALPPDQISAKQYPNVYAWVKRFQEAVSAAKKKAPKPATLSGEEAQELILGSPFGEKERPVKASDPLVVLDSFQKGQQVQLWPTDTGASHKDAGRLVSIDEDEVVIETSPTGAGGTTSSVRVHAPRHGFRVRPAEHL